MEIGTLKGLNVQPGDVVEYAGYNKRRATVAGWHNGRCYPTGADFGGAISLDSTGAWRIVSRATPPVDLTALEKPFGLLDAATQDALRAHGGKIECLEAHGWSETHWPTWQRHLTYRVKPAPKRETVTQDGWLCDDGDFWAGQQTDRTPVRRTFDRVDGQIDLSTYRVEAR